MGSDVHTQLDHTWYCASPQKLLARSRLYFTSKWTMILVPSPSQSRAVATRHWPALTMPQTTWEIHTLALRRTLTTSTNPWCQVEICLGCGCFLRSTAFTFLRQATEVAGKVSFIFYVKVSNDPESAPIPLQSRDYTALAGRNNVCTNLGKPYPCTAKDLDYPKKRDTWLDKNKDQMEVQEKLVGQTFKG